MYFIPFACYIIAGLVINLICHIEDRHGERTWFEHYFGSDFGEVFLGTLLWPAILITWIIHKLIKE